MVEIKRDDIHLIWGRFPELNRLLAKRIDSIMKGSPSDSSNLGKDYTKLISTSLVEEGVAVETLGEVKISLVKQAVNDFDETDERLVEVRKNLENVFGSEISSRISLELLQS